MIRFAWATNFQKRSYIKRERAIQRSRKMLIEQLETRRVLTAKILSTSFGSAGILTPGSNSMEVTFSEPVLGAYVAANYELRRAGNDGLLGNSDDTIIAVNSANYASGSHVATLNFAALVEDVYRLIVKDTITDAVGNALDGDGDNIAGGNGRLDFVVNKVDSVASNLDDVAMDKSFGLSGVVTTEFFNSPFSMEFARAIAIHGDGKIVAVGINGVLQYQPSGALDASFGTVGKAIFPGEAMSVAIQSDGKIVVAGFTTTNNRDIRLARYNSDGSLDSSFDEDGKITTALSQIDEVANSVAIQSDGKIVVAGYSGNDFAMVRYNTNGSLDTTFDGDGKLITDVQGRVDKATDVAIQSDGKILVAGYSNNENNSDFALVRYNSNGSLDPTFDGDGKATTAFGSADDSANSLAIQHDGKIVVVGVSFNGIHTDFALARYNANGSLDTTFDGDGRITTDFGATPDAAMSVAIQNNGSIVVAGVGGTLDEFELARYNIDGSLDTSFDGDGKVTTSIEVSYDMAYGLAIQSDGMIVVAGGSQGIRDNNFALARYNTNGSLDMSFDGDGTVTTDIATSTDIAQSVAIQSDGKIVVAGSSNNPSLVHDFALARYNQDGSLDETFDEDGKVITSFGSFAVALNVAIQNDGKILVAGYSKDRSVNNFTLARYNVNGSLDSTFDGDGKLISPLGAMTVSANSMSIQSDGKIVVAGVISIDNKYDFALARYNTDGSLDTTFDGDGIVVTDLQTFDDIARSLAIQTDGKIVVAGSSTNGNRGDFALVRYNSNGSLDTTFDGDGILTTSNGMLAGPNGLAMQSDGKILVAGTSRYSGLENDFALARYNANGSLDTTLGGTGILTTSIGASDDNASSIAIQSDGKIVVAGTSFSMGNNQNFALVRYNVNGSLDTTFDRDGKFVNDIGTLNDVVADLSIQSDGKIVVVGSIRNQRDNDFTIVRLDTKNNILQLVSPNGQLFDADRHDEGMGQLVQGSSNAFDGLNRLMVNGAIFGTATSPTMADGDRTIVTPSTSVAGLSVSRKVTVPTLGVQDFARTVDVFTNPSSSAISVSVQLLGNLGSDATTTVFATSDGDLIVEPTDLWFATDDAIATGGTPAIVHLLHGPFGLQPNSASVIDDNVRWTYKLTVAPGETKRLASFTILGTTRQQAVDSVNALVTLSGFGGQSAAFLTAADLSALANFQFHAAPSTKFYVVNDASTDRTYEYSVKGGSVEDYGLAVSNTAPRGSATTAKGSTVWVVDANKSVYLYDASGVLTGSWAAGGLQAAAELEGIATNGLDVWLVDNKTDRVYRYARAAGFTNGSPTPISSFSLNRGNASPKDIVTDGNYLWVVDDSTTDKVFKYTIGGWYVGSWTISTPGASSPSGITLDPTNPSMLWIVDSGTSKVYQYDNAARITFGIKSADYSWGLGAGNTTPQGIAAPSPSREFSQSLSLQSPFAGAVSRSSFSSTASDFGDFALQQFQTNVREIDDLMAVLGRLLEQPKTIVGTNRLKAVATNKSNNFSASVDAGVREVKWKQDCRLLHLGPRFRIASTTIASHLPSIQWGTKNEIPSLSPDVNGLRSSH